MSEAKTTGVPPESRRIWRLPSTAAGWWAVGLTLSVFPVAGILMSHMIPWPVLDTWVAPLALALLIDAAAIVSLAAVVRRRERSILTILALVISLPLAAFATMMVVSEAVFPQ